MNIKLSDWDHALHHLNVLRSRYDTTSKTKFQLDILEEIDELKVRYNAGEREVDFYKEIMRLK